MINNKIIIPKQIYLILLMATMLILGRIILFHSFSLVYMFWNLFLACIAFMISSILLLHQHEGKLTKPLFVIGGIFWLLFLPNSFYLITDLIHMGYGRSVPIFYDVFMLFSAGLAGVLIGIYSMLHIDKVLNSRYSKNTSFIIITIIMFLTSFGMYLGRFLRFNSWDMFTVPHVLLKQTFELIAHPARNIGAYGYITLFFFFIAISYNAWKESDLK